MLLYGGLPKIYETEDTLFLFYAILYLLECYTFISFESSGLLEILSFFNGSTFYSFIGLWYVLNASVRDMF
jgi:hypothetical protein